MRKSSAPASTTTAGGHDSGAQQIAERAFHAQVAAHWRRPVALVYSISTATAASNPANSRRRRRGGAPGRMRAPRDAPASTPSITGIARRGIDVAAAEMHAGAGGGGDADHETAGGGADLERQPHHLIERDDLDQAGADAEQSAEHSGEAHHAEAFGHVAHAVADRALRRGVIAIISEPGGNAIRRGGGDLLAGAPQGE